MDDLIHSLLQLDPVWVYSIIFFFAFIENLFPPSPSDMIIVFGGALAAMERGSFAAALLSATFGSLFGFLAMYGIGKWLGNSIIERGRLKFLPLDGIHKIEHWFTKYGFWLIVANRFLSGTRAVISLFAGMSNLDLLKTSILSFISSLLWNSILVYAGYALGRHWENIGYYLKTYSLIVTILVVGMILALAVRYFIKNRNKK